ncbi:type IV pilus biogenesis/stability protein PilW [Tatumella terrea]|uniref:Type IV pilus biogenesis/stability protein PilW n=1 Tax=Tatumella terrea TaxID=419007 RepID=A0ABW1VWY4_9GAMM
MFRYSGIIPGLPVVLLFAGCTPHPGPVAGEIRLQLGLQYLAVGEYTAAGRNLWRAVKASPDDYRPILGLARLYQTQGHDAMAGVCYTRAEKLAPENGYVLNNYGAFLCALRQYDKAQSRFLLATLSTTGDNRTQAMLSSGYCFLDEGQLTRAAEKLTTVSRTEPAAADKLLAEAGRRIERQKFADAGLLLDIYHQFRSASAESLWLKILYAARQNDANDVKRYGEQLARIFPLSIQYQRYLANEY